ncbi:cofactor-independent phosphoglycerate mutase [Limisalsivibrio acetivorans]|uniref:cofactor-independent phosphoglycerate mutase n=1 Tax=Limisalsivibrio acetivorans TaxID=1304888 RepID=UPI0003B4CCD8|nr:cofactor-independent phosphoglycerate mutase [Limisalsivibrio acetivorans]
MKYLVLLCDGMSDHKIEELGNKTVMEYADTSNFDYLAKNGVCGKIATAPGGLYPGSDICNLSVMGYDPHKYYSGRSPLEAGAMNIELGDRDMAFRCNLVTLTEDGKTMDDFSAHHAGNETGKRAIEALKEVFQDDDGVEFYPGVGYRHILVLRDVDFELKTTAPHDIMGKEIADHLPEGKGAERVREIMAKARVVFAGGGYERANAIWLWGEGGRPQMPLYKDLYGVEGSVVAAVDLIKGIGNFAGFRIIDVPGATGFIDTNFKGKAEYAVKALEDTDYVFVHVEAPDEAGHMGSVEEKVKAVENINSLMIPTILEGMKSFGDFRILVTPDHPTPVALRTHVNEPVPAIIYGTGVEADSNSEYTEYVDPSFFMEEGYKIAELFLKAPVIKG